MRSYKSYLSTEEVIDFSENFEEISLRELEDEKEVVSDAKRLYKSEDDLRDLLLTAEKGIHPEFAESLDVVFLSEQLEGEPSIVLPALSIAIYSHSTHRDPKDLFERPPKTDYAEQVLELAENMMGDMPVDNTSLAKYNKSNHSMIYGSFPEQVLPEINSEVMMPLKIFIDSNKGLEKFVSTINHEVTHALIQQKGGGYSGKEGLAFDEAAAHAVQNLITGDTDFPKYATRGYEEKYDLDRGITHTGLQIFLEAGEKQPSPKDGAKVVRELAVKTIKQYDGKEDILDILRQYSKSRDFKNLEKAARALMNAEKKTMSFFLTLKVIEPKFYRNFVENYFVSFENIFREEDDNFVTHDSDGEIVSERFDLEEIHEEIEKILNYFKSQNMKEEKEVMLNLKKEFKQLTKEHHSEEQVATEWIEEDKKELRSLQKKFMYANHTKRVDRTVSEKERRNNILNLLDKKIKLLGIALKRADDILDILSKMHKEEKKAGKIVKKYYEREDTSEIQRLILMTEDDYQKVKRAESQLKEAETELKRVREELASNN